MGCSHAYSYTADRDWARSNFRVLALKCICTKRAECYNSLPQDICILATVVPPRDQFQWRDALLRAL